MAPSARRIASFLVEREVAPLERAVLDVRDGNSTSTSSSSGPQGVTMPPHSVGAMVGVIVTLCTIVLLFAAWRIWAWRRRMRAGQTAAAAVPGLYDSVHDGESVKGLSFNEKKVVVNLLPAGPKAAVTRDAKMIYGSGTHNLLATPAPAKQQGPPPGLTIVAPPPGAVVPPSPRTAASLTPRAATGAESKKGLPRLVTVQSTFATNLHDELEIRVGEALRLLEEYNDGWCLVQRVGRADAERGVVPHLCIVDRPKVNGPDAI